VLIDCLQFLLTSFHSIKTERIIVASIFPAVGAVLATLSEPVLGGCTIMMFGTIVISGL
jgi:xanthine/uracil permease